MQKMTPAYALPWDFQAKTFDYRETIWGVYQDDNKIFPKSKNAVQHPGHYLKKVTVKQPSQHNSLYNSTQPSSPRVECCAKFGLHCLHNNTHELIDIPCVIFM